MWEKLENLDVTTRILIATGISLLFFVSYTYFLAPEQPQETTQQTEKQITTPNTTPTNQAPTTASSGIDAPANNSESKAAPAVSSEASGTDEKTDIIARINTPHFEMLIDKLGRVYQVYLKDKKFHLDSDENMPMFSPTVPLRPLEIRLKDNALNQQAFKTPYSASQSDITIENEPKTLTLTQALPELTITKKITFYPSGKYDLSVSSSKNLLFFITPGYRPTVDEDDFVFKGALVQEADDTLSKIEDGDATGTEFFSNAKMAAMSDQYYTTLLYSTSQGLNVAFSKDAQSNPLVFVEGKGRLDVNGYIGPKDFKLLESIEPQITSVVEYGFITFFAKPLFLFLRYIHEYTGNWGWSIVLLTLFIRVILYPLTYKGMVSMQKLKDLAPKVKEIQAKHKKDPQKMQAAMMELYKKNGANPFSGCLPLILQMPVFFAIYRVLYNAIELKGAEWILWYTDLSVMDDYLILPLLMGASMFVHQMITPTNFTDPLQEKVFKWLPVIFTVFFITFPAGLVLYWFANNVFSIIQQYIINKTMERKKLLAAAEKQ